MSAKNLAVLFGALALSACGSSSGTGTPDSGNGVVIDCTKDARISQYSPPISVTSSSGALDFILVSSNPGPPANGTNSWSMRITNTAGVNQPNLTVGVVPFMPDMGHGTSIVPSMTMNADGTYTVTPLYLFMAGIWRVTFSTPPSAAQPDTANIFFCIEG